MGGIHVSWLSVKRPSIEDLRQYLSTKMLPVHVVQKVVGSILEALTVNGVEYPIVRSQPIPHDLDLNDTHMYTGFYLNNLAYGTSFVL